MHSTKDESVESNAIHRARAGRTGDVNQVTVENGFLQGFAKGSRLSLTAAGIQWTETSRHLSFWEAEYLELGGYDVGIIEGQAWRLTYAEQGDGS